MSYSPKLIGFILGVAVAVQPVEANTYKIKVKKITVPSVCGEVLGPDLGPLASADVKLLVALNEQIMGATVTDQDGSFRIGQVKKGEYQLLVSAPGYYPMKWPLRVSKTNSRACPRSIVAFLTVPAHGMGVPIPFRVKRNYTSQ